MSWKFETIQTATPSSLGASSVLEFDGRDIWVSAGTSTYVYGYWDQNSDYEYLTYNYYFDDNIQSLYLYNTLATGSVLDMKYWNGKMYIMTTTNTIKVYDTSTKTLVDTLTTPETTQGKLALANNKVWVVGTALTASDQQNLYYYNILTSTWSSGIAITGRKQVTPVRDMIDGLNGYLYITSRNDHAVVKVDTTTGVMSGSHRINRHPYRLYATQNKDVYIASDAQTTSGDPDIPIAVMGVVSKLEQTTYTSTNIAAASGQMIDLVVDIIGNFMWYIGTISGLGRTNLTNNDFRYTLGTSVGTKIEGEYSPTRGIITPQFTYDKWNGSSFDTITVKPYLFFISGTTLYGVRLNSMIRENSYQVLGTAIIGTGDQAYFGEA